MLAELPAFGDWQNTCNVIPVAWRTVDQLFSVYEGVSVKIPA